MDTHLSHGSWKRSKWTSSVFVSAWAAPASSKWPGPSARKDCQWSRCLWFMTLHCPSRHIRIDWKVSVTKSQQWWHLHCNVNNYVLLIFNCLKTSWQADSYQQYEMYSFLKCHNKINFNAENILIVLLYFMSLWHICMNQLYTISLNQFFYLSLTLFLLKK